MPDTGARAKDNETIASFEETMDLSEGLTVCLFWKYPFNSFQKNGQVKMRKPSES